MTSHGTKRKRSNEASGSGAKRPDNSSQELTTDLIMKQTKDVIKNIKQKIAVQDSTDLKAYIIDQISNMDMMNKSNTNRKKVTIGIFGRSGEGKSSLLNAVLGERYLLPPGSSGACTAITTQVEGNLSDSNYTAEIEFISKEEWDSQLRDLLSDLSDKTEDKNDDMTKIAIEKITALYGANAFKKTLEELKKDAKSAKIDELLLMEKMPISHSNSVNFAKEISKFIQHSRSNPGNWYWPIVKSVAIKIPNPLLEHIVFVDIPGTGDCNKTRDSLWKSKLGECSVVWIVSAINRGTTDEDPWEILKHCVYYMTQAGECKSINFIFTKTDDIDPEEYIRNEWPSEEEKPNKDLKTACIRKRNICSKETVTESFENSKLKKKMILNIFTVSTRAFFDKTLCLEHSDTEIPKLQDVLKNLNNSINKDLARDYVNEAKGILSLIKSVQSETGNVVQTGVHNKLEQNLCKALEKLGWQFDMLCCVLEKCLSDGVEESERLCLTSACSIISPNLPHGKGGFHKILKALCKNDGYHWSNAWGIDLDLNMALAQHMHKNIEEEFDSIFPVHCKTGKSVQEQIEKFSIIQSDTEHPRASMFYHIDNFIKREEIKLKRKLKREVIERKNEISLSITNMIKDAMVPYYAKAAHFHGTGSMKKMQNTLTEAIENLKHDMFKQAKAEVLRKFRDLEQHIKDTLEYGLQRAILLLSETDKIKLDVLEDIKELENILQQLCD
ncbi:nuclear GTPase SLIP-GC-like isoform X1 [Carassius carassius]|uniref:nuclear GTPase SLIP-GC-like isoform X1 n=1 Tax=Carassius carassius TaxID=217509 RepID=UPI002869172B|nr:nuclear GTPase SLIP-GC-like isoform X1 [Carassius carassius]